MDELSSSDSDSDTDDEDYETIHLDCPAYIGPPPSFDHVVCDVVGNSTSARVGPTAKTASGSAEKPETENIGGGRVTKNAVDVGGLRNFEQDNGSDPVVVVWRSYSDNCSEHEGPEPEIQHDIDHVTQSVSLTLPCLEEVFSLSDSVCLTANSQRHARRDADKTVLSCLAGGVNWASLIGFSSR